MTAAPPPRRPWYRTLPAIAGFVTAAVVLVASAVLVIVLSQRADDAQTSAPSERTDITEWWSTAYPHITDLQQALDDSRQALTKMDRPGLTAACQRMHDAAGVDLAAHLPAPDADLTAELNAAAVDAHEAAHMCLSVLEQTLNNYDAEFTSNVDQADRHLKAAVAIVNRNLA